MNQIKIFKKSNLLIKNNYNNLMNGIIMKLFKKIVKKQYNYQPNQK